MEVTKDYIREKLEESQAWLERGILAIYEKQTNDEQESRATRKRNNVGFSGCDAARMSYYAEWIRSGKHLSGDHVEKAKKTMVKYAGQLEKIARGLI
jgi:hypothetical protein